MVAYTWGTKLREWPPLLPSLGWSVVADEACELGQHATPPPPPPCHTGLSRAMPSASHRFPVPLCSQAAFHSFPFLPKTKEAANTNM